MQKSGVVSVLYLCVSIVFWPITLWLGLINWVYTCFRRVYVILKVLPRDVSYLYKMSRLVSLLMYCQRKNSTVVSLYLQQLRKDPSRPFCYFEENVWTFQDIEDYSNQVGHVFSKAGYRRGDVVSLVMGNCPQFVGIWLGLAKVGVATALININLRGKSLAHCINIARSSAVVYASELSADIDNIKDLLNVKLERFQMGGTVLDAQNLQDLVANAPKTSPPLEPANFRDVFLYIYTSGTTGLPKAALINSSRFLLFTYAASVYLNLQKDDVIYTAIPLYHTAGGVLGVGVPLVFGNPVVIRKKFSASGYFSDCAKYKCTIGQYIGEIGRYIVAAPKKPEDTAHKVRAMIGVGMRPTVWRELQNRFHVRNIYEMYGATEGNVIFANLNNKVGAFGYIPRCIPASMYPMSIIRVDLETGTPIRDQRGFCMRCEVGEPGMLVGDIAANDPTRDFIGYVDKKATESKILHSVFKMGDKVFMTGDIVQMDEEGYLYFKDRAGDTFRWKGENVSTSELETVINEVIQLECAVYGVQVGDCDGKAGMVAIVDPGDQLDWDKLIEGIHKNLPAFAQPYFLRIMGSFPLTATFKVQKNELQKEGFDPRMIRDRLYFKQGRSFVPLTPQLYDNIISGRVKL